MILLLDAGNSRVKWAAWQAGQWLARGASAPEDIAGLAALWSGISAGLRPERIVASCVAGPAVASALAAQFDVLAAGRDVPVTWLRAVAAAHGVRTGYAVPGQLGSDRFALLVACQRLGLAPCVVIGAGTAVTMDALTGDGIHLGGIILPGLGLMRSSLAAGTAGVGSGAGRCAVFPTRTEDGVETGLLLAIRGAAAEMRSRLADYPGVGHSPAMVLTGGDGPHLAAGWQAEVVQRTDLVLEGLRLIAADLGAMDDKGT